MKRHVFDLDNTLIYTDSLNNDSYNYALFTLGFPSINDCKRVTRKIVFNRYPNMDDEKKNTIVSLKQQFFLNNIERTNPNNGMIKLLESLKAEECILWTSAEEKRVIALLEYYKLISAFKHILYSSKKEIKKDISMICDLLNCSIDNLIFYEDNENLLNELQSLDTTVVSP